MADMLVDVIRAQGVLVQSPPYESAPPYWWYGVRVGRVVGLFKRS